MKTEFLKNLGLTDEQIQSVMAENGKDITTLKTDVANLKDDIKVRDGVIETKNTKISELEKVDVETIKTAEYERGKTEGSKEIDDFKKQNALEKALTNHKVKDSSILSKMLDTEKVKFNDKYEIVEGLEEQITPLKESHDYLFASDKPLPHFADKTEGPIDKILTKEGFKKMSYNERATLKQNNPEEYKNLKEN